MYYGSRYCAKCKHNRNCYMSNTNPFDYKQNTNNCIIMRHIFEEAYKKENEEETNNG